MLIFAEIYAQMIFSFPRVFKKYQGEKKKRPHKTLNHMNYSLQSGKSSCTRQSLAWAYRYGLENNTWKAEENDLLSKGRNWGPHKRGQAYGGLVGHEKKRMAAFRLLGRGENSLISQNTQCILWPKTPFCTFWENKEQITGFCWHPEHTRQLCCEEKLVSYRLGLIFNFRPLPPLLNVSPCHCL